MVFTAVFLQSGLLARAIRSRTIRSRETFFLAWNAWSKEFAGNAIESKARVSTQNKLHNIVVNSVKDSKATILSQDKLRKRRAQVRMGFPAALADS